MNDISSPLNFVGGFCPGLDRGNGSTLGAQGIWLSSGQETKFKGEEILFIKVYVRLDAGHSVFD